MTFRIAFAILPLALALAGCSKDGADNSGTPAAPVAAAAAPAGQSWTDTVAKTDEGGYRMGNPDAPIKVIEYGSRLCPACGGFGREAFGPLQQKYISTGKVSLEFRDFLVHGVADLPPTLLGQCGDVSSYFPILEQMFQNQQSFNEKLEGMPADVKARLSAMKPNEVIGALGEQMGVIDFVKQRGIPEAKARACLADTGAVDKLTKQTQDASSVVTGTPTFLINGKVAPNILTLAQMEAALKAAGA